MGRKWIDLNSEFLDFLMNFLKKYNRSARKKTDFSGLTCLLPSMKWTRFLNKKPKIFHQTLLNYIRETCFKVTLTVFTSVGHKTKQTFLFLSPPEAIEIKEKTKELSHTSDVTRHQLLVSHRVASHRIVATCRMYRKRKKKKL